jgi:hypothetical protein
MKKIFLIITILISVSSYSQKIKLKNEKVLLDDVEILTFKKDSYYRETYFYDLKTKEEVVFVKKSDNGSPNYDGDDYVKIFFVKTNTKIESKSLRYGFKGEETIKKLIFDGVIEKDGSINLEKLKSFVEKYNDNIIK